MHHDESGWNAALTKVRDRQLLVRVKQHSDEQARKELIEYYLPLVCTRIAKLNSSQKLGEHDLEDAQQEAMKILMKAIDDYDLDDPRDCAFSTWLYRLIGDAQIDFLRHKRSQERHLDRHQRAGDVLDKGASRGKGGGGPRAVRPFGGGDPALAAETKECWEGWQAMLADLTPRQQVLRAGMEGLFTQPEIAAQLGCCQRKVRNDTRALRQKLLLAARRLGMEPGMSPG